MRFTSRISVEEFEAVAMPHFNDLYRTAVRVIGDRTEAEDLVQEAYLEAWKSFHRFELGTNCRAWLFKIMFHRLHHVRRRLVKASRVTTIDGPEGQDELAAEPVVPQEIRDEDVLNALEKIALEFR